PAAAASVRTGAVSPRVAVPEALEATLHLEALSDPTDDPAHLNFPRPKKEKPVAFIHLDDGLPLLPLVRREQGDLRLVGEFRMVPLDGCDYVRFRSQGVEIQDL